MPRINNMKDRAIYEVKCARLDCPGVMKNTVKPFLHAAKLAGAKVCVKVERDQDTFIEKLRCDRKVTITVHAPQDKLKALGEPQVGDYAWLHKSIKIIDPA